MDPAQLAYHVEEIHEDQIPELGHYVRLVRRNPEAVPAVMVNGTLVAKHGEVLPEIGKTIGAGQFLKATASRSSASTSRIPQPIDATLSSTDRELTTRAAFGGHSPVP